MMTKREYVVAFAHSFGRHVPEEGVRDAEKWADALGLTDEAELESAVQAMLSGYESGAMQEMRKLLEQVCAERDALRSERDDSESCIRRVRAERDELRAKLRRDYEANKQKAWGDYASKDLRKRLENVCAQRDHVQESLDEANEALRVARTEVANTQALCKKLNEREAWANVAAQSNKEIDTYLRHIEPALPKEYGMPLDGVRMVVNGFLSTISGLVAERKKVEAERDDALQDLLRVRAESQNACTLSVQWANTAHKLESEIMELKRWIPAGSDGREKKLREELKEVREYADELLKERDGYASRVDSDRDAIQSLRVQLRVVHDLFGPKL